MSNSNNEPGPSKNRVARLHPISKPGQSCEMGDEDGCPRPAMFLLDDPATYVKPLRCCKVHANDEVFYHHARLVPHAYT